MITGERDCRHNCCDDRGNPFHDHVLDPDRCPGCAREREDQEPGEVVALRRVVRRLFDGWTPSIGDDPAGDEWIRPQIGDAGRSYIEVDDITPAERDAIRQATRKDQT